MTSLKWPKGARHVANMFDRLLADALPTRFHKTDWLPAAPTKPARPRTLADLGRYLETLPPAQAQESAEDAAEQPHTQATQSVANNDPPPAYLTEWATKIMRGSH
jgi:hypothetical protein